jgi:hypothetical protein
MGSDLWELVLYMELPRQGFLRALGRSGLDRVMVLFGVACPGRASIPVFSRINLRVVLCIKRSYLQPTVSHSSLRFDPASPLGDDPAKGAGVAQAVRMSSSR